MPASRKDQPNWEKLERFRMSGYFQDVLKQRHLQSWGGDHLTELLTKPDDDFIETLRDFVLENTMVKEKTVLPILERNTVEEVRAAFSTLLNDDSTIYEALDAVWHLDGAGPYFATYMLALATEGDYILYEDALLEGMKEFAPVIAEDLGPVTDPESYFDFMRVCRVVAEAYEFTSFAELHEFLWHGYRTHWTFDSEEGAAHD